MEGEILKTSTGIASGVTTGNEISDEQLRVEYSRLFEDIAKEDFVVWSGSTMVIDTKMIAQLGAAFVGELADCFVVQLGIWLARQTLSDSKLKGGRPKDHIWMPLDGSGSVIKFTPGVIPKSKRERQELVDNFREFTEGYVLGALRKWELGE